MAKKRKGTTPHLRIRIEPELLARLEKSRTANNRTLTGEIVHRIEQTYRKSDDADLAILVYRAAFGQRTGDLLRAFATALWLIERRAGKKWDEDFNTGISAQLAVDEIFRWFMMPMGADFLARRAAFLKSEPSQLEKRRQTFRMARTAALNTLQQMGMAPSDAEIDAAAAKHHAEVSDADKSKDEGEGQ